MSIFDKITGRVGDILDEVRIPDDVNRVHEDAIRYIESGDSYKAQEILRKIAERHPNIQRTWALLARAQRAQNEWLAAWESTNKALEIRETALLHLRAAESMEKLGRTREAHHHLRSATELKDYQEYEFEISWALGRILLALGRKDKAERELKRAHKLHPNHWGCLDGLVRATASRDPKAALELLEQSDIQAPSKERQVLLGWLFEETGQIQRAKESYEAALDGGEPVARLGLARLVYKADPARAIELLQGNPDKNELKFSWFLIRGLAALKLEQFEDAQKALQRALELDSDNAQALIGLGRAQLSLGAFDMAGGNFQRALSSPKSRAEALVWLARWNVSRNELGTARYYLDEALREASELEVRAQALLELGKLLKAQGDFADAVVHLQEANTLGLQASDAAEASEVLEACFQELRYNWAHLPGAKDPLGLAHFLEEVNEWLSMDGRLARFIPQAQALMSQLNAPLALAIVGEFNAGKSTLLNALLGEDLLPVGVLPTTAHQGVVRFGPRRAARVYFTDDHDIKAEECDFEKASELMRENAEEIERIEFVFPHPSLRALEYWDTPGFNAIEERHEAVAERALNNAEAILWVMDANQVLSQTQFELIDRVKNGDEKIVVVINKVDRLQNPDDVQELVDYVTENIGDDILGVFPISALRARTEEDQAFEDFRAFVEERIVARAGRLKVLEVGRKSNELMGLIAEFRDRRINVLSRSMAVLDETKSWTSHALKDVEPKQAAIERDLDDKVEFLLTVIQKEVEETLRPSGQLITKLKLNEEDAEFLGRLVVDRVKDVLDPAYLGVLELFQSLETQLAQQLDVALEGLEIDEARSLQRRIEGFFDESRQARMVLEQRIRGQIVAETRGRCATGKEHLIKTAELDRSLWPSRIRELIPPVRAVFHDEAKSWGESWSRRSQLFLDRLRADVELIELQTKYILNIPERSRE